jgi:hypothetical protein
MRKREGVIIKSLVACIMETDELPSLLSKIPARASLPAPQYYERKINEPTKPMDKRGPFARYIDSEHLLGGAQSDFDYRSGAIPFCCRENELAQIDQFCASDKTVLWWAITGSGGSGKSRLVYEYIQTRVAEDWKALFLRDEFFAQVDGGGKYQQFNEWSHPKHLLLVIDYVQRYSKAVAQWIESVVAKKTGGNKIRVLLIERSGENGLWYRDFENRTRLLPYCFGEFLDLLPLSDQELEKIGREYAKSKERSSNELAISFAIRMLPDIDDQRRVLYFILLLNILFASPANKVDLGKMELLNYILRKELKDIEARFNGNAAAFKKYMQALAICTATKRISLGNPPTFLEDRIAQIFDCLDAASQAEKAVGARDGYIYPFAPDIIGEYLVPIALWDYFYPDREKTRFIACAWEECPQDFAAFLSRMIVDFDGVGFAPNVANWFAKMYSYPQDCSRTAQLCYFEMLCGALVMLRPEVASRYLSLVETAYIQDGKSADFARIYTKGVYIAFCERFVDMEQYSKTLRIIQRLRNDYPEDKTILKAWMEALLWLLEFEQKGKIKFRQLAEAANKDGAAQKAIIEYAETLNLSVEIPWMDAFKAVSAETERENDGLSVEVSPQQFDETYCAVNLLRELLNKHGSSASLRRKITTLLARTLILYIAMCKVEYVKEPLADLLSILPAQHGNKEIYKVYALWFPLMRHNFIDEADDALKDGLSQLERLIHEGMSVEELRDLWSQ